VEGRGKRREVKGAGTGEREGGERRGMGRGKGKEKGGHPFCPPTFNVLPPRMQIFDQNFVYLTEQRDSVKVAAFA